LPDILASLQVRVWLSARLPTLRSWSHCAVPLRAPAAAPAAPWLVSGPGLYAAPLTRGNLTPGRGRRRAGTRGQGGQKPGAAV